MVLMGKVSNHNVLTMRDSGCDGVVVKRAYVKPEQFTGGHQVCLVIDGTVRRYPVAETFIDTPFYTGKTLVSCMDEPVRDLIVGNIPGVKDSDDLPDTPDKDEQNEISKEIDNLQTLRAQMQPLKRKKHKKAKGDVQLKAGLSLERTAALLRAEGVSKSKEKKLKKSKEKKRKKREHRRSSPSSSSSDSGSDSDSSEESNPSEDEDESRKQKSVNKKSSHQRKRTGSPSYSDDERTSSKQIQRHQGHIKAILVIKGNIARIHIMKRIDIQSQNRKLTTTRRPDVWHTKQETMSFS